jgi:ribonuclease HII
MPPVQTEHDHSKLTRETVLCLAACKQFGVSSVLLCALDEVGRGCIAGPVHSCVGFWHFSATKQKHNKSFSKIAGLIADSKKLSPKARSAINTLYRNQWQIFEPDDSVHESNLHSSEMNSWPKTLLQKWTDSLSTPEICMKMKSQKGGIFAADLLGSSLGAASSGEIDALNIWKAVQLAFNRALALGLQSLKSVHDLWCDPACAIVLLMDGKLPIALHDSLLTPIRQKVTQVVAVGGDGLFASVGLSSILAKTFRDSHISALGQDYPGYGFEKHKGYGTALHFERIRQLSVTPQHRQSFLKNL